MEETPHVVAHFMAVGAEKRLEDYHFLRNTYETVSAQEIQLNRILRMLGEDEISLNWRIDVSPVGRARARSLYDFDRWNNALVLQGSMAYERLRELQQDNSKNDRQTTPPAPSRRIQELRDRRQRFSEQRDYVPSSNFTTGGGRASTPSSSRLRALAEYDVGLAETEAKRQRQSEDNRSNARKSEEKEFTTERRREKFKTMFDDENQKYEKSNKQEDELSKRSARNARFSENDDESSKRSARNARFNENDDESNKRSTRNARFSENEDQPSKRLTKDARSNGDENETSTRFAKTARSNENEDESSNRSTRNTRFNGDENESSNRSAKNARSNENEDESSKRLTKDSGSNGDENESNNRLAKKDRFNEDESESSKRLSKDTRVEEKEDESSKRLARNNRFNENEDESSKRLTKDSHSNGDESESSKHLTKEAPPEEKEDESSKRLARSNRFNKDDDESSKRLTKNTEPDENEDGSSKRRIKDARSEEEKEDESSKSSTKNDRFNKNENESSNQLAKNARPDKDEDESSKPLTKNDRFNKTEDESSKPSTKKDRFNRNEDESSNESAKNARTDKDEDKSSKPLTKNDRFNKKEDESSKPLTKNDRFNKKEDESSKPVTKNDRPDEDEDDSSNHLAKDDRFNEDESKKSTSNRESDSDKNRKSSIDYAHDKSENIELISFTVRCQAVPSYNKKDEDNEESSVRLLCQWASPSSSSAINYYTIERQIGDEEWLPIGEKIDKLQNKSQLDISSSDNDEKNEDVPSHFRLKAHLKNGQTFTSKPTDGILINLFKEKKIITPAVEILSPNSVQLIWEEEEKEDEESEDNNNEEKPNIYDIEKKEEDQPEWEKVTEVPLSQHSARIDSLTDASQCEFRLIPSSSDAEEITKTEDEVEPEEVLTVDNVNEWLNSLNISPTSPTTVDIDISEEGFQEFDSYKVEYTTSDQLNQWKQMSAITQDDPHLTINNLKQGTDYKFRFTPVLPRTTKATNETNPSQLSLVLDVKMPSKRKGRFDKDEIEAPVVAAAPAPEFSIQKIDPTSVLIEAVVPKDEPATFEDTFDVFSKKETIDEDEDDDWTKVGTIDKDHLSTTVEDLEENTAYAFKIDNITTPSADEENNTVKEFKLEATPVKKYDPSLFLEKIEQSLENVVNGVMQAAAGHQTLEEPVNKSLNEVIKEIFRDETLVPSEKSGFDTLELSTDLQVYRGPKQMMLKELEVTETIDLSKHYGEIIIHNYRTLQHGHKSVVVREENGNTRVGNIDGDIIIRNVVSDVLLSNEETRHKLAMNIVGQAFLKGVQGTLIASKFKGIIVVKNVNKP